MKVTLVNTYPNGGAGIACTRLQTALNKNGIDAKILHSHHIGSNFPFYAETLSFMAHERNKASRFSFSQGKFGKSIKDHPLIKTADIIHLHWINQGFLSLNGIASLSELGKPIVWTLHDMWAFTGGCHYSNVCTRYKNTCGNCQFLRFPKDNDLSSSLLQKKASTYPKNINFVTCSKWLENAALNSKLLANKKVQTIANPIDTKEFSPLTEEEIFCTRKNFGISETEKIILFSAMKISDERKGFHYLKKALNELKISHPNQEFTILIMGNADKSIIENLPFRTQLLGLLKSPKTIRKAYGVSDVFVAPSLEDNLPNTVMESLACGTPVAAFETGGIPEMVTHLKEGYIAETKDYQSLASGVFFICTSNSKELRTNARKKVLNNYSEEIVSSKYLELYSKII